MTAATTVSRILCAMAEAYGVPVDDVLAGHAVERSRLEDPDARVPGQLDMDLFDALAERAREPALGVRMAMMRSPLSFDLADYVARNSPDLLSAMHDVLRYQRLLFDHVAVELRVEKDVARFVHHAPPGLRSSRHATECFLGTLVTRARSLSGVDWVPLAVSLRDPPPADDTPYRQLFRCDVAFSQRVAEVVLDRAVLDYPNAGADASLYAILERDAGERVARLTSTSTSTFRDEVRREVGRLLRGTVPSATAVARRLGMSARNLHRLLRDEGTTYQELVDQVRLAMAGAYLADRRVKAVEVGFLLGFSDASAFYRAFRRWTGMTPVEYRAARPAKTTSVAAAVRGLHPRRRRWRPATIELRLPPMRGVTPGDTKRAGGPEAIRSGDSRRHSRSKTSCARTPHDPPFC